MPHVRITLSREMLQMLLTNLADTRSPASEFVVENETDGLKEITRIINILSGDVFEQVIQKQEDQPQKNDCKIYEFPGKKSKGEE
jgi:hypothetical protein